MYNTDDYCPNCIEKLQSVTKPLGPMGGKRVFLQCSQCGYNIIKSSKVFYNEADREDFKETKLISNNSFTNQYKENGVHSEDILRHRINRAE